MDPILDRVRLEAEQCDRVEDILFYSSHGGGTGAGLTNSVAKRMNVEFKKNQYVKIALVPSPN